MISFSTVGKCPSPWVGGHSNVVILDKNFEKGKIKTGEMYKKGRKGKEKEKMGSKEYYKYKIARN